MRTPSPPLGSADLPLVDIPAILGSSVTPDALRASSTPFLLFPENTLVRATLSPPVEETSRPSLPLGAAPLNASRPQKVLKVTNPLARPATSMPFWPLPAD